MTQWGLDTLFNPSKRHMDEEKRRLQSTQAEVGDSSGGRRIDLESGRVTIQRKAPENAQPTNDAQPEVDPPELDQPDAVQPDTVQPEADQPELDQPDAVQPETIESGPEQTK